MTHTYTSSGGIRIKEALLDEAKTVTSLLPGTRAPSAGHNVIGLHLKVDEFH